MDPHDIPLPLLTTARMAETRAGEGSIPAMPEKPRPPRPPEQQSGSDNNENCGYEVSGKSAIQ